MPLINKEISRNCFVGRVFEQRRVLDAASSGEASILIVYGRRRVGKTELIEHTLKDRHLIKFEGIEGANTQTQIQHVLHQLSGILDDRFVAKLDLKTWVEVFELIADRLNVGEVSLYFEEVQWLAVYKNDFIADLKYVWDNYFRHNPNLLLVLCGSSPSFMINNVVHSKALYNRSMYELNLMEFSLAETREFLQGRSQQEVMDAYLTVGGIPEYLKRLKKHSSIQIGICENSFQKDSFFSKEHGRIFISSFSENIHYLGIVELLSKVKYCTRKNIEEKLNVEGGGNLTNILTDLEQCGFIERYHPYQVADGSKLVRYCIADNYLRFYFKFIKPIQAEIDHGDFNDNPMHALNKESYQTWMGYAFERFCRKNHRDVAKVLGFSAVRYKSGVYFNRSTDKQHAGFQIDLIFDRADHVLSICEIKYLRGKVGKEVIDDFERKLRLLPNPKNKTIEKILISAQGASDALINQVYFDRIITLSDLMGGRAHL